MILQQQADGGAHHGEEHELADNLWRPLPGGDAGLEGWVAASENRPTNRNIHEVKDADVARAADMAHNRHIHGEEHGAHERHEIAHLNAEVVERDEAHAHQAQQRRGDMPLGDALLEPE